MPCLPLIPIQEFTTEQDTMASNEMPVGQARYYHDKKAFITAQVRLLEAPVQLPSDWRRTRSRLNNDGTAHTSIPDSVVSSVLGKGMLRLPNSYPDRTTRHLEVDRAT